MELGATLYVKNTLAKDGTILREIGELPWSPCSADVLDKYGVYWYITV